MPATGVLLPRDINVMDVVYEQGLFLSRMLRFYSMSDVDVFFVGSTDRARKCVMVITVVDSQDGSGTIRGERKMVGRNIGEERGVRSV